MWLRRTKSKTRIHNSFSCSSFKDIQSLCSDDNNISAVTNNSSSPSRPKRVATVFHRVRRANSVLAAFSPLKDSALPVLPLDHNENANVATNLDHQSHLKDPILPVLPSPQKGNANVDTVDHQSHLKYPTLPVLPSEQTKNSNDVTIDHELILKDPILPVLPSEQTKNSNAATIYLPGTEKRIVIYFTSLRVIRSTFEDCKAARSILHAFRVKIDERDVSMDSRFTVELHKTFGEDKDKTKISLPRVFIDGRYIGGAEEVRQLHEAGELKKYVEGLLPADPGTCEVCRGYGFILCDKCNGSRKCYSEKGGFRTCTACNENGLLRCPTCSSAPL